VAKLRIEVSTLDVHIAMTGKHRRSLGDLSMCTEGLDGLVEWNAAEILKYSLCRLSPLRPIEVSIVREGKERKARTHSNTIIP
jgi:hypothetical protein